MIYDSVENIEVYCEQDDPIYKAVQYVLALDLITRDVSRYRTYFPTVRLICPE